MAVGTDDLIGVPRLSAARIIDVSERRLRSWNSKGLVYPSFVSELRDREMWSYSLEDLVQGRIVRQLEDRGIHILHIRRVVEAVRSSIHPNPLASLAWGVSGKEVFVGYPDDSWVGDRAPTQNVIIQVLDLDEIRNDARRAARSRPEGASGTAESRRGKLGSQDVFAGTRIPIAAILGYIERGATTERILQGFPNLTTADVELARSMAS